MGHSVGRSIRQSRDRIVVAKLPRMPLPHGPGSVSPHHGCAA
jgi:hypothetical protein